DDDRRAGRLRQANGAFLTGTAFLVQSPSWNPKPAYVPRSSIDFRTPIRAAPRRARVTLSNKWRKRLATTWSGYSTRAPMKTKRFKLIRATPKPLALDCPTWEP